MTLLVLVDAPKDAPPPVNNLPPDAEFRQEDGVTIVTFASATTAYELAAQADKTPTPIPA